jgi:hypothetical protein
LTNAATSSGRRTMSLFAPTAEIDQIEASAPRIFATRS